jgi:hypothetical protein
MDKKEFFNEIINSSEQSWNIIPLYSAKENEHYENAILESNIEISIKRGANQESFHEDWAKNYPDENPIKYSIDFYYKGNLIESDFIISIDGGRGEILIPEKEGINIFFSKKRYILAKTIEKIFNNNSITIDEIVSKNNIKIND